MEKGKVWYAFQTNSMKCPSWVLYFRIHAQVAFQGLPWWLSGKESACQRRRSKSHGSERSPGEGNSNPFPYPCLENPMDRGVCRLQPRDFSSCLNTISAQYPSDGACENLLLFITWSVSCQIVGIFFFKCGSMKGQPLPERTEVIHIRSVYLLDNFPCKLFLKHSLDASQRHTME